MKLIFAAATLLIVYGSLYPFDFAALSAADLRSRLATLGSLQLTMRGDMLGNFALFVPFGFFGSLAFLRQEDDAAPIVRLAVAGLALALVLQLGQLALPTRDPSLVDVGLNAMGIAVGVLIARIPRVSRLALGLSSARRLDVPLYLAGMWVVSQLVPLVPTLDLSVVRTALKPLLLQPVASIPEAVLYFAAWLAALHMLDRQFPGARLGKLLPFLPLAVLAPQPFIVSGEITPGEVAGSVAAGLVWLVARSWLKPMALGVLLLAATLGSNLLPWEASVWARDFHWVPFASLLEGNMSANSAALLRKLFLYGGSVWLFRSGGSTWLGAGGVVFLAVGMQEAAQIVSLRGSPDITDLLLAAIAAGGLASIDRHSSARPTSTGLRVRAAVHLPPSPAPPAVGTPAENDRLAGLDGLRAIAALAVFGVHFNQMAGLDANLGPFDLGRWLANGNTGVALFFVLSGFLLSMPFWRQVHGSGSTVNVGSYVVRRLARILPAYYLCLFGLLGIMLASGGAPSINNVLSHIVFLYNLNDWNILSLNAPFWTLAVEMQFYLVLPLLMLGLRRLSARAALTAVSLLVVGTYLANYGLMSFLLARGQWPIQVSLIWPFSLYISGPGSFVLTYSTLAHATYFLIGIATALLFVLGARGSGAQSSGAAGSRADWVFWSCAGVVLLVLSTPLDDMLQAPHGHYNWPFVPLLLAAMIYVTPRSRLARNLLETAPLRWLGLISYGFYIFHYPVQKLFARLLGQAGLSMTQFWWLFAALSLAGSMAVAALSFRLLERPVMRLVSGRRQDVVRQPPHGEAPGMVALRTQPGNSPVAGADWRQITVQFRGRQLAALREIANAQRVSLSAAARHLLTMHIADHAALAASLPSQAAVDADADDDQAAVCRVNIRSRQHEFLLHGAQRLGCSVDVFFGLIVDHQRRAQTQQPSGRSSEQGT